MTNLELAQAMLACIDSQRTVVPVGSGGEGQIAEIRFLSPPSITISKEADRMPLDRQQYENRRGDSGGCYRTEQALHIIPPVHERHVPRRGGSHPGY